MASSRAPPRRRRLRVDRAREIGGGLRVRPAAARGQAHLVLDRAGRGAAVERLLPGGERILRAPLGLGRERILLELPPWLRRGALGQGVSLGQGAVDRERAVEQEEQGGNGGDPEHAATLRRQSPHEDGDDDGNGDETGQARQRPCAGFTRGIAAPDRVGAEQAPDLPREGETGVD